MLGLSAEKASSMNCQCTCVRAVAECCVYADADVDPNLERQRVRLTLAPKDFAGAEINASTLEGMAALLGITGTATGWCNAWVQAVEMDVQCALRVPSNRIEVPSQDCTTSGSSNLEVEIDFLALRSSGTGETPLELVQKLNAQISHPQSEIWKGYGTRYLKEVQASHGVVASTWLPVEYGWSSCLFPTVDWLVTDVGRGESATQKVSHVGSSVYLAGYTTGA